MTSKRPNICMIGSILGRNPNHITTQGQILADLLIIEGYEVTCVSSKLNRTARIAEIVMTLINERKKTDIAIIEVYSGAGFIIANTAGMLCRIFNIPTIMVLHGGNLPDFAHKHPHWIGEVLKNANQLIAPSGFLADELGKLGYQIKVIPNVIDWDLYQYRERRNISPKLIWMRSFHSIYNPQMAVKVLAELKKTFPNATLTMAGADKGLLEKVKKLAREVEVFEAINFVGFLTSEQKQKEFSKADIYLNTNRFDNLPVSVIEACAFGLPVVATNVGGLPYLLKDGENGFLVENGNVQMMTERVIELLENPVLTHSISSNARQTSQKFAWNHIKFEWGKLFETILHQENLMEENTNAKHKTAS